MVQGQISNSARKADPNSSVPLLSRDAFLQEVDHRIDKSRGQDDRLWVGVASFPALTVLQVSRGSEAGEEMLDEILERFRESFPEAIGLALLFSGEVAIASQGPVQPKHRRLEPQSYRRHGAVVLSVGGVPMFTSVRAGYCFHRAGDGAADMLRKARLAHWAALSDEGTDAVVYGEKHEAVAQRHTDLLHDLAPAMESDQLILHYQPKIDLVTGRMVGAEALVRWPQPDGSLLCPGDFVPLAEQTGLIVTLGSWSLTRSCRQASYWRDAGVPAFRVGVNISPVQFMKTAVDKTVETVLEQWHLPPAWLEIEVTENVTAAYSDHTVAVVESLRDLGVAVSLDDFGTGYSSLAMLSRLPVERIKIDRAFLDQGFGEDGQPGPLLRAMVSIAQNLGLKAVAEGVETAEQAEHLTRLGCHEAQGYFYAKPLPPEEIPAFVKKVGVVAP